ncbi:MAG TPA: indolepyruvate ferredoxin oxidoreductase family protein, partial [Rhizobiales bacterium]|nr:indolepyruvate ferredoxin oxidoreductase family protein [Hyphomicrobiales bacterium]
PLPQVPSLEKNFAMVITGVGGTGVVTLGALIGMAAHLEGKGCGIIDMAGLAQKGGAVISNLRLAPSPDDIQAIRVAAGGADLVLGCDMVVAASQKVLSCIQTGHTRLAVNSHETITADFTLNPDAELQGDQIKTVIKARAGEEYVEFINAGTLATQLMGDSIAANLFLLGFAWQKGLLPLSHDALTSAIKINGVNVAMNMAAFLWGRRAAYRQALVENLARPVPASPDPQPPADLDTLMARRMDDLKAYQNEALAARYKALVDKVRSAELAMGESGERLSRAVMMNYFKLLSYKDEYEVARLFSNGEFEAMIREAFTGDTRMTFQFAPPFIAHRDKSTHRLRKFRFGPWMMPVLRLLARLKILRGSLLDPFRYQPERKLERALIREYEQDMVSILEHLTPQNIQIAAEIAGLPASIRGFGPLKIQAAAKASEKRTEIFARFYGKSAST